jgi:hypothetical protein
MKLKFVVVFMTFLALFTACSAENHFNTKGEPFKLKGTITHPYGIWELLPSSVKCNSGQKVDHIASYTLKIDATESLLVISYQLTQSEKDKGWQHEPITTIPVTLTENDDWTFRMVTEKDHTKIKCFFKNKKNNNTLEKCEFRGPNVKPMDYIEFDTRVTFMQEHTFDLHQNSNSNPNQNENLYIEFDEDFMCKDKSGSKSELTPSTKPL